MQKKPDGHFRELFTHQFWQQHQVVVVNPENVVRAQRIHHRFAEDLVDVPVFLPVVLLVMRQRREIMEQRPEGLVAKTEVKPIHALLRQINRTGIEFLFGISPHRCLMFRRDACASPAHP